MVDQEHTYSPGRYDAELYLRSLDNKTLEVAAVWYSPLCKSIYEGCHICVRASYVAHVQRIVAKSKPDSSVIRLPAVHNLFH